jgi:hypothetical protein
MIDNLLNGIPVPTDPALVCLAGLVITIVIVVVVLVLAGTGGEQSAPSAPESDVDPRYWDGKMGYAIVGSDGRRFEEHPHGYNNSLARVRDNVRHDRYYMNIEMSDKYDYDRADGGKRGKKKYSSAEEEYLASHQEFSRPGETETEFARRMEEKYLGERSFRNQPRTSRVKTTKQPWDADQMNW